MVHPRAHATCPPLDEWLGSLAQPVAVLLTGAVPRSLRGFLERWPAVESAAEGLGAMVVVGDLDEEERAAALRQVCPGGWIVELVHIPGGLARAVLAVREAPNRQAALGYASLQRWVAHGVCDVSQYHCERPVELVVTCGRVRR